jgi:hemolysin III
MWRGKAPRAAEVVEDAAERVAGAVEEAAERVADAVKPHLRGWLHAATFPLALAGGIVLVALSPTREARVTTAIFSLTAVLLFGVSAIYHRGNWSPRWHATLKRLDHANIFLVIAGTYTPFTVLLLDDSKAQLLLWIVWAGALAGVAFRVLWIGAPRWLYTPVYIALGWVAALFLPEFLNVGGPTVLALVILGGALYSIGGIVYAARRPNPSPRWFGFHEVFHALTLAAFFSHYAAISLVAYQYT